ncbi:MAG: hypothetical protein U5Q16_15205 [Gammaproteobacteria bacterium]|nr:hypothetical protein [Gammaproteobacteria bacterium]
MGFGTIIAAFGLVSGCCYTHYDLTRERHDEVLRELWRRRGREEPVVGGQPASFTGPGRVR